MQRVLVINGTGYPGSTFVRHLVGQTGARVTVVGHGVPHPPDPLRAIPAHRVRFDFEDLADRDLVDRAVGEHDTVVYFGEDESDDCPTAVVDAVGRHKSRLHCSWAGTPDVARQEERVRSWAANGVRVTATVATGIYGPWQDIEQFVARTITDVLAGRPARVTGDGQKERDWVHAHDHAAAVLLAVQGGRGGAVYPVSATRSTEIEVARTVLRLRRRGEHEIEHLLDQVHADPHPPTDASRTRSELYWRPRYDLEAGVAATIAWYREQELWWQPMWPAVEPASSIAR